MDILTTALIAGAIEACKDTAAQAVKDSYAALKGGVRAWLADDSSISHALATLDAAPEHPQHQQTVAEKIEIATAGKNPPAEIEHGLKDLLDALAKFGAPTAEQNIGIVIDELRGRLVRFGNVTAPAKGIGAKIRRVDADKISFGNIG